jgi:site-specific DNA-methyltransferase (adenine-specific)
MQYQWGAKVGGWMSEYKLYLGDCLEYMKTMPDKSVDAVITDPPYNVGINYGIAKDNLSHNDYLTLIETHIREYDRIASGNIVLILGSKVLKDWWDFIPDAKLIVVRMGAVSDNKIKGLSLQYHPILTTVESNTYNRDLWEDIRWPGEGYYFNEPRYGHPAMTPLKLAKRLVIYFTPDGGTIFEPFAGSGTMLVAGLETNRNAIGCEINPEYYAIAEKRIKQAQRQMIMPLG